MSMKTEAAQLNAHPNKIGIKEAIGYMFGDAGNLFVLTFISTFLKIFYTDILKIDPVQIAVLFLLTRLWDAVNDPIWGVIVAKRRPGKNGKYLPYIKWVSVPLGLSTVLCFLNYRGITQNGTLILALAYLTYTAFGMLYTGMNIPYGSLASVVTDDPAGRTLLSTFRSIGGGLGGGIVLILAPMVVYTKEEHINSAGEVVKYDITSASGMLVFAVIMAAFSVAFYMLCYKTTKERVPSEKEPNVDMKRTYMGLLKSKPFIAIALTGILVSGQLQFASYNQYLYKNFFENKNLAIIGTVANYLPMAILILFMPKLVARFGKKELSGAGALLSAVSAIAVAVLQPGRDQAALFMFFLFLIGLGYSFVSITVWAVVADVIDYQEYKTGIRSESAVYAVYTFSRKVGQTLADTGGMLLIGWAGYSEANANLGYVEGVGERLMILCTVIPAVVYTLVFICMQFLYPLSKDNLKPIYSFMQEKRAVVVQE